LVLVVEQVVLQDLAAVFKEMMVAHHQLVHLFHQQVVAVVEVILDLLDAQAVLEEEVHSSH
jgi:hypothetical protein